MHDVAELKRYAEVHARAQHIGDYRDVLERIDSDKPGGDGSWVREWGRSADALRERGEPLAAVRHDTMARFPYVDSAARREAQDRCVATFERWGRGHGIEPLELALPGGRLRCWTHGLSGRHRRPLLLVCGGIVSTKEQWAPALPGLGRLGFAGVVAELPGVGENALRYHEDSWRFIPAILDALAGRADTDHAYALAISFSGHAALRAAVADTRIRGVVTVGAPVSDFFTDPHWQGGLPRLTVDTLAHLTGVPAADVFSTVKSWALRPAELAALDIPVAYCASRRDEIIPPGEPATLARHVRRLWLTAHDDVHGSPRHVAQTRLWGARSLLKMRGGAPVPRAVLGAAMTLLRARDRLTAGAGR